MKIAILNSVYKYGSTGRICFDLCSYLRSNNIDSFVFFGRNFSTCDNKFGLYFGNKFGFFLHVLISRIFDNAGFCSSYSTKKLIKKLEKYNPDLIILNNLHGYYLNIDLFLNWIKRHSKKTILVTHDCWNITGHCAYFDFANCNKWEKECFKCSCKKNYPKSYFCDRSKQNYLRKKELFQSISNMTIVCPSKWIANIMKNSFLGDKPIKVINNGIDINVFRFNRQNFRNKFNLLNKKLILCIANVFDERKGIYDIIKLSKELGDDELIVLVGKLNRKICLTNNIVHVPQTNDIHELVDIYSSCDVMFNPTFEDTFSNTNMEAISCKLPVVCYNTGGAIEMVDDKFVVEKGDYRGAYNLIKKIFAKTIIYNFSQHNFSKEKMNDEYLNLIIDILKKDKQ